jgi:hypothetical protein
MFSALKSLTQGTPMKTEFQDPASPAPTQEAGELLKILANHPFLHGMNMSHFQMLADSAMLKEFAQGFT